MRYELESVKSWPLLGIKSYSSGQVCLLGLQNQHMCWNPAKLYFKNKAPKKGREKETRGKDQSPIPKEVGRLEEMNPLRTKSSTSHTKAYQLKKGEVNLIKLQA